MTQEHNDHQTLAQQCVICARHTCDLDQPHPHPQHRSCTADCPCRQQACTRRDAAATLIVCRRCYERMERQLLEIPELYALAAAEMLPGGQSGGGRSSEPSLGIRLAALDLRSGADLFAELGRLDMLLRRHAGIADADWTVRSRHHTDPVGQTIIDLVNGLVAALHGAAKTYPGFPDLSRDLTRIHHAARTAARTTGRHHQRVDCPADSTQGICGAHIQITGHDLADVVDCPRCGTHWEIQRLLLVAASDQVAGVWCTAEDAAVLLTVSERSIRRWAKEGRVQRANGLYEVASIRAAIQEGGRRDGVSA